MHIKVGRWNLSRKDKGNRRDGGTVDGTVYKNERIADRKGTKVWCQKNNMRQ